MTVPLERALSKLGVATRAEARALWDGRDLYGPLPGVHGLGTYPPFAAAGFTPLLFMPDDVAGLISLPVKLVLLLDSMVTESGPITGPGCFSAER